MKAEIKARYSPEGRTRLETVIPIPVPYLVFLDPSSICNATCSWCPTGSGAYREYYKPGLMDWRLFGKIIDGFRKFPTPVKTLRMYLVGEPLLNPSFISMVRYAKLSGCFKSIDTTTNGTLLSSKRSMELATSGMDKIFISVPGDYDKHYKKNIAFLHKCSQGRMKIYCKIINDGKVNLDKFHEDFENICDYINVEYPSPCWPGFNEEAYGDQVKGIYGQDATPDIDVCPYVFYSLSIMSDGKVSACFVDWKRELIVGDLTKENIVEVWKRMEDIQVMMLNKKRKEIEVCKHCKHHTVGAPDNIDQYVEELLGRYL